MVAWRDEGPWRGVARRLAEYRRRGLGRLLTEDTVRFAVAEELVAAGVDPATLHVEVPHPGLDGARLDLTVGDPITAVLELKFPRDSTSAATARTMILGHVLADFYRLAAFPHRVDRVFVLVQHRRLRGHLYYVAGRYGVDLDAPEVRLAPADIARLPHTATQILATLAADRTVTADRLAAVDVDDDLRLVVYLVHPATTEAPATSTGRLTSNPAPAERNGRSTPTEHQLPALTDARPPEPIAADQNGSSTPHNPAEPGPETSPPAQRARSPRADGPPRSARPRRAPARRTAASTDATNPTPPEHAAEAVNPTQLAAPGRATAAASPTRAAAGEHAAAANPTQLAVPGHAAAQTSPTQAAAPDQATAAASPTQAAIPDHAATQVSPTQAAAPDQAAAAVSPTQPAAPEHAIGMTSPTQLTAPDHAAAAVSPTQAAAPDRATAARNPTRTAASADRAPSSRNAPLDSAAVSADPSNSTKRRKPAGVDPSSPTPAVPSAACGGVIPGQRATTERRTPSVSAPTPARTATSRRAAAPTKTASADTTTPQRTTPSQGSALPTRDPASAVDHSPKTSAHSRTAPRTKKSPPTNKPAQKAQPADSTPRTAPTPPPRSTASEPRPGAADPAVSNGSRGAILAAARVVLARTGAETFSPAEIVAELADSGYAATTVRTMITTHLRRGPDASVERVDRGRYRLR